MKMILCVAVGVFVDMPDDNSAVCVPSPTNPIDELAARLRGETDANRKNSRPDFTMPGVTAWMAAAFQEYPERN